MNLIRLTANQPTFHEVTFRPKGITIIIGKRKTAEKKKDDTYNGVGKSLLIALLNFCLGSQGKDEFANKLPGWEFTLEFRIGDKKHSVTRATLDQENVVLNGVKTDLDDYREWLGKELFSLNSNVPFLTFRMLIGLFLRPGKHAYDSYDRLHYSEIPYQKLIRNAYLLGIETKLIRSKYEIKQALDQASEMNARFSKDPIIRDYFVGTKDLNIDLKEMEDGLRKLEKDHTEFKVAENYKEIESEANDKRRDIQSMRNEIYCIDGIVAQIEDSLKHSGVIPKERIAEMYEAAGIKLPGAIVKELRELEDFHHQLLKTRDTRLASELKKNKARQQSLQAQLALANSELNAKVRFLGTHGAFSEYTALTERLNEKRNEVQRLRDFKKLTKEYKEKTQELKVQLGEENIKASKYIEEHESEINLTTDVFRSFCKRLYPGKKSALIVTNNDGDNQTRFDIEAKILSDASDGINEVKIFCFDATVLLARKNHNVNFLFHDSRLFSDIDPRQRAELFRIAADFTANDDFQYIATLNEDHAEAMRPWFAEGEFEKLISDNVVLELTDESAADRLLGIEVDLDYDKTNRRNEVTRD